MTSSICIRIVVELEDSQADVSEIHETCNHLQWIAPFLSYSHCDH